MLSPPQTRSPSARISRALGAYGIRIDPKLNWFFFVEQP